MKVSTPISVGELFDKITILEIKKAKIKDKNKLKLVRKELSLLKKIVSKKKLRKKNILSSIRSLQIINKKLWNVEDRLRTFEKNKKFKYEFVKQARSVYHLNDKRSQLKNKINLMSNSDINEVKSYEKY